VSLIRRMAAALPNAVQAELKRLHFARQIASGTFHPGEPEYERLPDWVSAGDWVLDVGANVGHYTKRFSELVGRTGRVVAVEPVPETFALLAANCRRFDHDNVTLINVAASEGMRVVRMELPRSAAGSTNYYQARIRENDERDDRGSVSALALPLGPLMGDAPVRLIKVDAEGHELAVLQGLTALIDRAKPVLIVEGFSPAVTAHLSPLGYRPSRLDGSPNTVHICA
jgi:FkbM family methyltransferase